MIFISDPAASTADAASYQENDGTTVNLILDVGGDVLPHTWNNPVAKRYFADRIIVNLPGASVGS